MSFPFLSHAISSVVLSQRTIHMIEAQKMTVVMKLPSEKIPTNEKTILTIHRPLILLAIWSLLAW